MPILIAITVILGTFGFAGWLGLRVKPKPFPPFPERTPAMETIDLPADLPPPVERFFKTIIGEKIPVIESAVLTGSATLKVFGISFPSRFRMTHIAGQGYRHYLEATIFGYPIMKVNESYLDGKGRMELPFGIIENEPKIDSAANLGLWAESIWLPSILITDSRVRWEAIDDTTARLIVPFGEDEDVFTVAFDPETGLLRALEAQRYREAKDEQKILWRNEAIEWKAFHGIQIPSPASTIWMDQGKPWSIWTMEDVVYNVDVAEYIRAKGL